MKVTQMSIRSIAVAAALLTAGFSASALTLNFAGTQSNSVLAFSTDAQGLFEANGGYVSPLGNTKRVGDSEYTFTMPVTNVVVNGSLKIASGSAVGSALEIVREVSRPAPAVYGVTLANFTLDYINNVVLADVNARGGPVTKQSVTFSFRPVNPLALKYKFPLTITGHEVLDTLKLGAAPTATILAGLNLASSLTQAVLDTDFGTLTQDISTNARKPAANATPYPQQ